MKCSTSKNGYATKALAEESLIDFRGRSYFREGSGPIAVYQCDDCGEWHFTSKGEPSELLKDEAVKSQIQQQREAEFWTRKLR